MISAASKANMRYWICAVVFLGFLPVARADDQRLVAGCPLIPAQKGVQIIPGDGPFPPTLVYPVTIDKTYTGCTYAWFNDDRQTLLISSARFELGSLVVATDAMISSLRPKTCTYRGDNEATDPQCSNLKLFWKYTYDAEFMEKFQQLLKREKSSP